ncbi:conserved hypothetical protein [Anaeromyxobacter sp. K]|uniref:hypothetical protein n=1 Tax=Anaeromyxobacter sp. (strain K) TaxID=447217 RepID=UPI00015F929C|nr:hypothetical protein [Anaeromyxobacter sp. K]ACG74829.1 conserved hypothetical protein [Anaeromyxobacter sp. K]
MARVARWFLTVEAAAFLAAAGVHSGVLWRGHEHARAATAETVIGLVLAAALLATIARRASTRRFAVGAQAFALLGTAVGLFTIAIGIGPRTAPDLAFHAAVIVLLVAGLLRLSRERLAGRPVRGSAV